MDNILDAPSSYAETIGELKEQERVNKLFVENAKKSFIESYKDLEIAGFTKDQILALLN